ncbi:sensor domain-containing protein [Planomonospora sp. ID82291]|uniref:sensor domain-containing protein n=1 Tax=Planomonospora sp. ID82291 TaxID=2738136 RepID=UPI0018C39E2F|nr:sensor domain-containing protein [Planomonospora sp. ID82291]MBG0814587.1 sensor domain-containing protein [Planomonospora sp. ID82291]
MTGPFPSAVRRRFRAGAGSVLRTGRRTIAESLYLLTAPVTAAAGLLLVLVGLCVGAVGLLVPGAAPVAVRGLAPVRWFADVERWRITRLRSSAGARAPVAEVRTTAAEVRTTAAEVRGTAAEVRATTAEVRGTTAEVRATTAGAEDAGRRRRPGETAAASDPGLWLGLAHAVAVLPVALVTSAVTAMWWFAGLGGGTSALRNPYSSTGQMRPLTLTVGDARSHIALSLGLTSPAERLAFGTAVGLLLLLTLPLVTRACVAVQAGLGEALLSDTSALHRRISGLEQERDAARAQTVAVVTAEAIALRRLERDIHDGPQQRLVRLAMELGRAQHHFDSRPEAVRTALADAIVQTEEALEELRALSRGIAPPILVDRGLHAALTALAARSTVPADLDAGPLDRRLDAAAETAAYFVVAEALTNVAKHSRAGRCVIGLRHDAGNLRVWVTDDGVGGAAPDKGHGLRGLEDRLQAVGGLLRITSPRGGPTTVTAELPCR